MGLLVSLQRLLTLGNQVVVYRPTLAQYALHYRLSSTSPALNAFWSKLRLLMGAGAPASALTGLYHFLKDNAQLDYATICLNANCEVGFEIRSGIVTIDAHDGELYSCTLDEVVQELENLHSAYDAQR